MRKNSILIILVVALFAFSSCQTSLFSDRSQHHHLNKVAVDSPDPDIAALNKEQINTSEPQVTDPSYQINKNQESLESSTQLAPIISIINQTQSNSSNNPLSILSLPSWSKMKVARVAQSAISDNHSSADIWTFFIYFLIIILVLALLSFLIPGLVDLLIWILVILLLIWIIVFLINQV